MSTTDEPLDLVLGRDAASLIIYDDQGMVLWAKRGDSAPFLGGYWAFVGGMVSKEDVSNDESRLHSLKRAALREASEELNIDVSSSILMELQWIGRWSTHPYLTKSIVCEFFAVKAEALGIQATGWQKDRFEPTSELSEAVWLQGDVMLNKWILGEVTFAPPTLAICRALADKYPLQEAPQRNAQLHVLNQVTPSIQLIALRTPTLPPATHTNTYLLGEKTFYLIDPGSRHPTELKTLFSLIDQRCSNGDQFVGVILTHHHQDHVGGLKAVIQRYQIPIHAHILTAELLKLKDSIPLAEGDILRWKTYIDGVDYTEVWHTPGHAPGHICLVHTPTESAIVGDMVAGVGTIVIDPDDGDMASYLESLARLKRRCLRRLLPSHGPPIAASKAVLTHYINHRRAREEKIRRSLPEASAINQGGGTVKWLTLAQVVERAYADAPLVVRKGVYGGLAGRSALSHLIHLQKQGYAISSDPQPTVKSRWIAHHESLDQVSKSAARLMSMMTTLRVQCPWDKAQTLETLRRYLIEESYEVLDSFEQPEEHCEELGDLFFQILFQSIIREQEKAFDLSDVMDALAAKLSRRHPHVFGDLIVDDLDQVQGLWRQIKEQERVGKSKDTKAPSILDGVPKSAPSLLRAQLIGEKAASVGFDWPSLEGALAKVDEERIEITEAIAVGDQQEILAEVGDLFFALVNVCRHLGISPEVALEKTNSTFSDRFKYVESLAESRSLQLNELNIDELESLWREAKSFMKHRQSQN